MPYARRYRRRPRKYLRKAKRTGARRGGVSQRIKKYVKQAIHKQIENKKSMQYAANNAITVGTFSTQCKSLLIGIGQGTGESARVGNQIKIVKGMLNIYYNLLPYDAVYNPNGSPVWVRVWIIRDLVVGKQTTELNDATKIFAGQNGSLPFQNNMLDMSLPINNDAYRVLYQTTFKLGTASTLSGSFPTSANFSDSSPMSKHLTINWGKWCKKILKFDDNVSPYLPQNENLYLVHQAVNANGVSITDAQKLVEFHFVNQQFFEDA